MNGPSPLFVGVLAILCAAVSSCSSDPDVGDRPIRRPSTRDTLAQPTPATTDSSVSSTIKELAEAGGHHSRVVFTPGNSWAEEFVLSRMKALGADARKYSFNVGRRGGGETTLSNIVAHVPGTSDSCIVLVAHIDACANRSPGWLGGWRSAVAPGANDNATGVSVLLELLKRTMHAGKRPRYTILFAVVNAEERNPDYGGPARRLRHHLGSRSLASWLVRTRASVRCALAIDMVGWHPSRDQVALFSSHAGQSVAKELRGRIEAGGGSLRVVGGTMNCRYSDNESFEQAGMPSLLIMEACRPWRGEGDRPRNPWYHTSADTPEHVRLSTVVATVDWLWDWLEWLRASGTTPVQPRTDVAGPDPS